jgi:hypothetical protein
LTRNSLNSCITSILDIDRALIDLLPPKTLRKPNYLESKSVTFSQVAKFCSKKAQRHIWNDKTIPDQLLVILRTISFISGFEKKAFSTGGPIVKSRAPSTMGRAGRKMHIIWSCDVLLYA